MRRHIVCIQLEHDNRHRTFGGFALVFKKAIMQSRFYRWVQPSSSSDTHILHHVVGLTLPLAQPPVQTQLQTSESATLLQPNTRTSLWNSATHLVVKSAVFPLQDLLDRSSGLWGNNSISLSSLPVLAPTDSVLWPCGSTSPSCWGRWRATSWSLRCSSSRGSHTGATSHSLATSSSDSCWHGWYWP